MPDMGKKRRRRKRRFRLDRVRLPPWLFYLIVGLAVLAAVTLLVMGLLSPPVER